MRIEPLLLLSATLAGMSAVGLWVHTFWGEPITPNPSDWSAFGSYIGGVLSPVLGFIGFVGLLLTIRQQGSDTDKTLAHQQVAMDQGLSQHQANLTNQRTAADDKNFFDHAVLSLERAFSVISTNPEEVGPTRHRLAWLTCARLLLASADAAAQISEESKGLAVLYSGERVHWQFRFYELFHSTLPPVGRDVRYFSRNDGEPGTEIDERSIRVVFEFLQWPDDKADSIDRVPRYTVAELREMRITMAGVRDFLLPAAERKEARN